MVAAVGQEAVEAAAALAGQLEAAPEGLDGGGAITLRDLVRASLRQRPDRIVVGEVRGAEALDLHMALNAGCSGMATLHANSAQDALEKLIGYCVLAADNVAIPFVRRAVAASIDVVVFVRRSPDGRRVDEIAEVTGHIDSETIATRPVFTRGDSGLRWCGQTGAAS